MKRWTIALVAMLFLPVAAFAGTTGKITGRVVDKDGGGPLPGANVVVLGAPSVIGATTDSDGQYTILNVPAGTYNLKCTFIGYQEVLVKGFIVSPDLTTTGDFALAPQTLEAEVLEVVAERPLVQKDQTNSLRLVTSKDLDYMPVRGYAAATSLQSGVTNLGGNLYIRGGRFSEVDYIVDGVSQRDLQTGAASTNLNSDAIDQVAVIVGGFEAEYGRAMSGVVKVVTKEGGRNYSGSVEYITDELTGRSWLNTPSFGYNNADATLGGPIVPGSDKLSFFVSGERRDRLDRSPTWGVEAQPWEKPASLLTDAEAAQWGGISDRPQLTADQWNKLNDGVKPHNSLDGWGWQAKLSYRAGDRLTVKAGMVGSTSNYLSYIHSYRYDLAHSPKVERMNNSLFAKGLYTFNAKTFLTLEVNAFNNLYKAGDGTHFNNLYDYGRPNGNPRFNAENLFASADVDSTPISRDADGFITGDEGRVYDDYLQRSSFYITPIDFNLTSQISRNHQFKVGGDLQWHRLRYYHHLFPVLSYRGPYLGPDNPGGFQDADRYGYNFDYWKKKIVPLNDKNDRDTKKQPILGSFYVQDKMEYDGLIINMGLRYDYLNARTKVLKDAAQPLGGDSKLDPSDLSGNSVYHKLSPRVGVGFPVTDRTVFHMNYGIFYQQPNLEDLYVGLDYLEYKAPLGGYYYSFGNPNLKPEKTSAYEVGLVQQVSDNASIDATAYYKAVENLVEVTTIPSTPAAFSSYRNRDYGTIKGLDVGFLMRRKGRTSARLSYSLSYATGTGSSPETQRNIAWTFQPGVTEPPKTTAPLDFDQRHKLSASVDYRFVDNDGPVFMGHHVLANAGLNVLVSAGSGFPYTPTYTFNEVTTLSVSSRPSGPLNSSNGPWTFQVDAKANKHFKLGHFNGEAYVWVLNLFNRANVAGRDTDSRGIESAVYSSTGSALTTGWLNTAEGRDFIKNYGTLGQEEYQLAEKDPRNFDTPRQVRFGLALSF